MSNSIYADAKNGLKPKIGIIACYDCKTEVDIRANKNAIGYYFCDCGDHHRFNRKRSQKLIAKQARIESKGNKPSKVETPKIEKIDPEVIDHGSSTPNRQPEPTPSPDWF